MFSRNMERLSLAAVGSAAGYQLLTLVSAGFGDALPGWTHHAVEIATAAVFMLQLWAFTKWEKLSNYYAAVEHSYNRQLAGGQASMVRAALSQTDTVVVEADDENKSIPTPASEADADISGNGDLAVPTALSKVVKLLPQSTKRVRLEDRIMALEALAKAHPELSAKDLAAQVGLGESSVRRWQKESR